MKKSQIVLSALFSSLLLSFSLLPAAGVYAAVGSAQQTGSASAGMLGFAIVLLSAALSSAIVFFVIRHSKQGTLPVALGSERSRAAGVIMK